MAEHVKQSLGHVAGSPGLLSRVDHLIYATPDLERGSAEIEKLLGVRADIGGKHPGRGTHNALLSLGPRVYLEIIAPDPSQTERAGLEAFGLDTLEQSKLITWSANGSDLDEIYRTASRNGIPVGNVAAGSRQRPDGVLLRWQFTEPSVAKTDGLIPFFIDWGNSPHPAQSTPSGATLVSLRAEHPNAGAFQKQLEQLRLPLRVDSGPAPALIAVVDTPRGLVELR
jgi:Glyoxalase-like domain